MKSSWLKETSRDLLAFGSIPFYFLVIIRSVIGRYSLFVYQMLIAAFVIFIIYFIIKDSNIYVARSFAIVVFTSIFYKEQLYTSFAFFVWLLLLLAAYHLKRNLGAIFRGILIGVLSTLTGYYGALYLT